ncbi:MAG: MBL fold metallo-hydrolase [Gemmatimonadaceae bacterium]
MPLRSALVPFVAVAALFSTSSVTCGQATSMTARALIDSALERLGGKEHISGHRKWFIAGVGVEDLSAELQGITPDGPTVRPHAEWLGVDAARHAVAWERRTPRNDQSLRWRRFVYRHDSTGVIVWTDSTGRMNAGAVPETRRRALMRRIPHLLLLESAQAESLQLGRAAMLFGRRHQEVRVRLDDAWISLWLSADSSVFRRAEYRTLLPGRGDVVVQWEWPVWKRAAGVVLRPDGHRIVVAGRAYQRVEYQRFDVASSAADSLLDVPNELRARRTGMTMTAQPRPDALPPSGEVAPGVHVEEFAGFNSLIVEFTDFILLVEAPAAHPGLEAIPATRAADRIGADLAARVRAIARGRPLRYTVLTHHHSDHIGNAPALADLTRLFLVPSDSKNLIEGAITAARRRSGIRQGGSLPARVEPIVGVRTIRDSTRTLVIYDVVANPHSRHNLFVWLPHEQIGFQGDLFYYDEGAAGPPADRRAISAFFARWLRDRGISPRAVYGVHSSGSAGAGVLNAALSQR